MGYFATALVRRDARWTGREIDLDDLDDLDAVLDLLRDLAGDDTATALLLVEEDDEWLGIVRVDGDGDPRVFVSDARVLDHSEVATLLFEDAPRSGVEEPEDDEESVPRPETEPAGDIDLLTDLGTSGGELLALCAEEGMLPADVISAVCEKAGCLEVVEELRET